MKNDSTARLILTWSILLALFSLSWAVSAQGAGGQTLRGHVPPAVAALKAMGPLAGTNHLDLAIGLPLRNAGKLGQLLREITDPASPNYRQYLTPAQFTEQFGPSAADYEAVAAFATAHKLKVTGTHPNRLLLDVSGAVADIEQALHVKMQVYQHPTEARTFYAPDSEPSLDLATPVLHVSGLDNYSLPRPCLRPVLFAQAKPDLTGSGPGGAYLGNDFRAAYVPGVTLTGTGQTVGLLEFDSGYYQSDITAYETLGGLPNVPVSAVLLDGYGGGPGYGNDEVSLDIEMAISMAPGLTGVIVYEGSVTDDILSRMATDNMAKQIGASWTYPIDATSEQIFLQFAAQGQSFFNASGDSDAYVGAVPSPSDDPNIMIVGGTTLTTSGPGGSWVSETVWNWGNRQGTGGGISTSYQIPNWQTNISMAANQGSTIMRNVPDVAMTADNVYVTFGGGRGGAFGGTSCATPLWAAFTALVNQRAVASGRPTVGFINPALDTIGSGQAYTTCFHDITTGNNTSPYSPTKFYAVTGYDLCTGWGVPAGQSLINALATPDPLGIQPDAGFTAIGGSGGPFTVTSESFVLSNSGTNSLNWSLVNTSLWLAVSPSSGTLGAGSSNGTPLVSLSAAAYSLPIGNYSAVVAFSNVTSGFAQNRQFALQVVPSVPPTIVTQPTNQTVFVGYNAAFDVTAGGTPPLTYQWQFNGTNINGATNPLLTLTNVSFIEAGSYSVTVTNTLGTTNSANAVLTVNPPPPCAPITSGLVDWWPGNGNATDTVGTNNGTIPDPVDVTFGPGEVNQAFAFSGISPGHNDTGNEVDFGTNVANFGTNDFTVDFWMKQPPSATGLYGILEKRPGCNADVNFWDIQSGHVWNLPDSGPGRLFTDISGDGVAYFTPMVANKVINDGVFHHVAYVRQGLTLAIYIDGIMDTNTTATGIANIDNPAMFRAGQSICEGISSTPESPFVGELDELDLYNRALSPAEIYAIYAAAVTGKCPPAPTPPVILVQPQGQYAVAGGSATFSVTAEGGMPLSYQWSDNTTNILNATNSSLTLTNLALTDAGLYAVTVSNSLGSVVSSNAVLTMGYPPAITSQPQSQAVIQGSNVSFTVGVTGTGPLGYQWSFDNVPLLRATNSSLTLTNVQGANSGSYSVIVSSPFGAVLSSSAVLTVDLPPTIVTQPTNQTVFVGYNAAFDVTAGGTPPLTYQWQFNGTNINGATNPLLTLTNVSFIEAGSYSVTVTNTLGTTNSANAVLTVNPPPPCAPITSGLVDWWPGNGNATDTVGTNNGTIPDPVDVTFGPGEVNQAFAFSGISPGHNDTGNEVDFGTNVANFGTNDFTVDFWMKQPPSATGLYGILEKRPGCNADVNFWDIQSGHVWNLPDSGPGRLFTDISGDGVAYFTPMVANKVINDGVFHHVAYVRQGLTLAIYIDGIMDTNTTATGIANIDNPAMFRAGQSICEGISSTPESPFVGELDELDLYNRALSPAEIYAIYAAGSEGKCGMPPHILIQPQGETIAVGSAATFSVTADGPPPLNYQWTGNGTNIAGATNSSLILVNVQTTNDGIYTVTVSNLAGATTSSNAVLNVGSPPIIRVQPASQSVELYCAATFNVSVGGFNPLSYQWWNNGRVMGGQTNSSLVLTNVQVSSFGSYSVIITNVLGATISAVAVLGPASPPVANPVTILRFAAGGVRMNTADLTANDVVASYDTLTVVAVSSNSTAGGNVSLNSPWIYYTPPPGVAINSDTFTYTVSDGHCGIATGTVTVQVKTDNPQPSHFAIGLMGDGSLQLSFDGIPGQTYHVDYSENLSPPNWQILTNQAADGFGVFQVTDWPTTNGPGRFYRAVWP